MNVHEKPAKADEIAAELTLEGKSTQDAGAQRHARARRHRRRQALSRHRLLHLRSGLHLDRQLHRRASPTSTATRACCSIAAIRSTSWPSSRASSRSATCCCNGELPTKAQFDDFRSTITRHTMVHEQMTRFFTGFRRDAHPMAVMVGTVGALSAFYHDCTDINDPEQRAVASYRMIAKMPTIAAMAYKYSIGQPFIYPRNDLDFTSNFLQMCFAIPCEPYVVEPGPDDARSTASSSCTPTTSRTPRPRPCASPAPRAPIRSPASPPASPACGVRRTAAPTRRRSTC